VEKGELNAGILESGLDYDRWRNTFSRLKDPPQAPFFVGLDPLPSKQQLTTALIGYIDMSMRKWSEATMFDLAHMCITNHRQFLELKGLAEKSKGSLSYFKEKLPDIHGCLKKCTFTVPLLSLSDSLQEEIIHWIFRNEDRVWRYRGGRDGRETLHQFMSFLCRQNANPRVVSTYEVPKKVFAGVITFCVPCALQCEELESISNDFQVASMVAYAVGEMLKPTRDLDNSPVRWQPQHRDSCYEVVTAWVHQRYRGLNLGVQLYLTIAEQVPTRLVMCDMLEGSVEKIIWSNRLLRALEGLHIISFIVQSRQQSYAVVTPAEMGKKEREGLLFAGS
jgi:hypothetical protein